jgi:hypothetical protein
MKHFLMSLLAIFVLPAVACGTDIQLYSFALNGTSMQVHREVMSIDWTRAGSYPSDGNARKVVIGDTILMRPSPGGVRAAGNLGPIQQGSLYLASFVRAYRQAVRQTSEVPTTGELKVDRLVGGAVPNVDDSYAASIAVHLMAMFRGAYIPDTSILLGALQDDGRIGAVTLFPAKVLLLLPYSHKLFVPSGQLATLGPEALKQIEQYPVRLEEVDTLEQAYQLMVRTR